MDARISAENEGLLEYAIHSNPSPLQVSPAEGAPLVASLTIVVSNPGDTPVNCKEIRFAFTIGDEAQDLTAQKKDFLYSASPDNEWQIDEIVPGQYSATPRKPEYQRFVGNSVTFQLYSIQVNRRVGTAELKVLEESAPDETSFEIRRNSFKLAKFPYGFFVHNFHANKPMVKNGEPVTLSWTGSEQADYHILFDDQDVDVSKTRTWTTKGLNRDTNFILKASVQQLGETVTAYRNTMVSVANPDLMATSLTVLKESVLRGSTTIGSGDGSASLAVTGTLSANGDAKVGGTLAASGNAMIGGTLTAAGAAQAESLKVNGNTTIGGTLSTGGAATLAGLTVTGDVAFSAANVAQLNVTGGMAAMGAAKPHGVNTWYTAPTDGMVVGYIGVGGDASKRCATFAYIRAGGIEMWANGGNTVFNARDKDTYYYANNPNTFQFPVRKGTGWNVEVSHSQYNEVNASVYLWWVPFGSTATLSEAEEVQHEPMCAPTTAEVAVLMPDGAMDELTTVVEELVGATASAERKERLAKAIRRLRTPAPK